MSRLNNKDTAWKRTKYLKILIDTINTITVIY